MLKRSNVLLLCNYVEQEYLLSRNFVYCDLVVCNIFVGDNKEVKVVDFGFSCYVYEENVYYCSKQ